MLLKLILLCIFTLLVWELENLKSQMADTVFLLDITILYYTC